jgi:hypothetical protein
MDEVAMKRSSILLLTVLLPLLAVSQIGKRDGVSDHQIRPSSGNFEDCLRLLCRGSANLEYMIANVERFFILGTDHVLAQTDREKTADNSKQPTNQGQELFYQIILSEGFLGGLLGAFLISSASLYIGEILPFTLKGKSKWETFGKIILFFICGGIVGALLHYILQLPERKGMFYAIASPPYTFFLLNGDIELYRNRHLPI